MRAPRPNYPRARLADVVDTYHGVRVADPYRWLEDASSAETIAWVQAENELTRSILDGSARDARVRRLTELYDYPRTGVPLERGGRYFFTFNPGLQNQGTLYVIDDGQADPRVLLDPNTLSPDGTVALTALFVDDDGELMVYGLSHAGSDLQELLVRDIATGADLPDRIRWVKFASVAWLKDGTGFYYTRFPEPGTVAPGDENYFNRICLHRLGDAQEKDRLVYERPDERETVFHIDVSHGGRWGVIAAYKGASDKSEIYLLDCAAPDATPLPLFTGFDSAYAFIQESRGRLLFQTDNRAARGRIVAVDPLSAEVSELVAESPDKLSTTVLAGDTIVASYLHNASDQLRLFDDASGAPAGVVDLPGIGSISGLTGRPGSSVFFLGFTSFTQPSTNLRYDLSSHTLQRWSVQTPDSQLPTPHSKPQTPNSKLQTPSSKLPTYVTEQVWYPSRDGTLVSMFLVHRADLPQDGRRPVLLTGYGGFNISLTPAFDPANFVLLEAGGICAVANLRGGGEYGEQWHEAGIFERKQNVFDDFIAAAEWLAASGDTNPKKIAIEGGSNGGLLTAAVMLQRPELFGAVVCRVPVVDMLRYHLFTVGRFWMSEYGSADDPEQFQYLLKYSPLHNVKEDVTYPPVLIATADTDDRVSPGMAKKFAARLQAAAQGGPFLIRVETKAGHGAGKPVAKVIEEDADIFSFLFKSRDL
ncbi:MAG: hypothetical protein A3G21_26440 [Acidobacteria bacterium RIFCSPLOWO2_12_FULL_66_21]|nr:MAG: hypothetical protein A3G21_26440 [Acidobacteria bacterium RIFCSPLOWO2_12_FULL_66_21]